MTHLSFFAIASKHMQSGCFSPAVHSSSPPTCGASAWTGRHWAISPRKTSPARPYPRISRITPAFARAGGSGLLP